MFDKLSLYMTNVKKKKKIVNLFIRTITAIVPAYNKLYQEEPHLKHFM